MADKHKQKLIQFLERRVWNPVLRASSGRRSESERKRLERVQRKTETQRERYRGYANAGEVRQEFDDDLRSQPAKRVASDLERLGLPTQREVADDFFALADRLGVRAERGPRAPHAPHPPHPWHKKKPEAREAARRELTRQARRGDRRAIATLRTAPRKWARDLAEEPTRTRSGRGSKKKAAASRASPKRASRKAA